MVAERRRALRGALACILTLGVAPGLVNCGSIPGADVPGGGGACPSSPDDIFKANFGLAAEAEAKVKAGLAAAANLEKVAARFEGEVATACGGIAKDLGATDADIQPKEQGPGKQAEAACAAAANLIGEFKAKAQGTLKVEAQQPTCRASMDAMADCAAQCDANIQPGSVDVQCEGGELSGQCDAECKGTCSLEAGAKCEGTCTGTCNGACTAGFTGKCEGKCEGKCDGKNAKGQCAGTCDGQCSSGASGSCNGKCDGECSAECKVDADGKCEGTCSGECSVAMKAPKCSGEVKPPEMSAECEANCDAKLSAELECTPPSIAVTIDGAADAEAASKLKAALVANLPALLKVTMGMKGAVEDAAASVSATVEGLTAAIEGGGAAALKVAPCIAAAAKAQVQATASINVSVKASASASGSAQAG